MAMAAPAWRIASSSSSLLPGLSRPAIFSPFKLASAYIQSLSLPRLPSMVMAVPAAISLNIPSLPGLLEEIWESVLRAVPKKKTTHSKKRHRQMAGKALKDVTALCKCPACGELKRMHYLCPNCAAKLAKKMDALAKQSSPTKSP